MWEKPQREPCSSLSQPWSLSQSFLIDKMVTIISILLQGLLRDTNERLCRNWED